MIKPSIRIIYSKRFRCISGKFRKIIIINTALVISIFIVNHIIAATIRNNRTYSHIISPYYFPHSVTHHAARVSA